MIDTQVCQLSYRFLMKSQKVPKSPAPLMGEGQGEGEKKGRVNITFYEAVFFGQIREQMTYHQFA